MGKIISWQKLTNDRNRDHPIYEQAKSYYRKKKRSQTYCNRCNKLKRIVGKEIPYTEKRQKRGLCYCGRMSTYKREYADDIRQWFDDKGERLVSILRKTTKEGKKKKEETEVVAFFPTFQEWSSELGINESCRATRVEKYEEFREANEYCKQVQKQLYYTWSSAGLLPASFMRFFGSEELNIIEKQDIGFSLVDLAKRGKDGNIEEKPDTAIDKEEGETPREAKEE